MRIQRILATTAVLAALTSVTACEKDDKEGGAAAGGTAAAGSASASAAPGASSAPPSAAPGGRVPEASMGLASADDLAALRRLVHDHHSVDCKTFSTDPQTVSIQSIDYLPAVEGNVKDWGVSERGLCGEPAGAQRAHGLVWLDKVANMAVFQERAKAAQLAELKENGRIRATRSKLLVGTNIAVETNNRHARIGLYQQQFLYLNCEAGFTAPQGFRFEKAMADGCVLTNYEAEYDGENAAR
ncbi:hypothetical protein [Streptomyces griseocarneus]|uniref:hypothetical protein n=1 Tax=Streptomyces griseocarneus TaxID=51201 RepID=UPI00167D8758|nr:hypothetical protein [Streptomyces griseocarneus]MBZ6474100.1 hypothetical protein [Streptomyces griseocarneus]GHG52099.1 hypothetical protein GCM10018779_12880 [Streptomyces griseocarneus]